MRTPIVRRSWLAALPALLLALAACDGSMDLAPAEEAAPRIPMTASAVTAINEPAGFAWLEPLVDGTPGGALVSGLAPDVVICDIDAPAVPCVELVAREGDEHYIANWTTERSWDDHTFSIVASLNGIVMGSLRVTLDRGGAVNAGRTFPVKFWVGDLLEVADCVGDDRCNASEADPNEETVITTRDENGNIMAALVIPLGAAGEPLDVILDCREDGFAPMAGPLPTLLDQWPLFCSVDVTDKQGAPFEGPLAIPATVEICVVDNEVAGQAPWHGFSDHTDLVLGKSPGSGGFDFELLPFVGTEIISDCQGRTITVDGNGGFGGLVGRAFDGLLNLTGPRELNAAARVRRDGGVGGTLTAFSDINPVSPAYVGGTVKEFGGTGIAGVSLQLTGGDLASPVAAVTDAGGNFFFGEPLEAAAPSGTDYTVEVLGGTSGFIVGGPTQTVNVDGSGTFSVDFVTQGEIVISDFGAIYKDVKLEGPSGPTDLVNAKAPFYTNTYTCPITTNANPLLALATLTTLGLAGPNDGWGRGFAGSATSPRVEYLATLTLDVFVPLGTDRLEIIGYVDNDAKVEINGTDITGTVVPASGAAGYTRGDTKYDAASGWFLHGGCADLPGTLPLFTAASGTFTPGQTNTLTFMVRDYGTVGYADFKVTAVAGS